MGKKEEEEIIRIAKKMDKMAQKKSAVRMNEQPALICSLCCMAAR